MLDLEPLFPFSQQELSLSRFLEYGTSCSSLGAKANKDSPNQ